MTVEEAVTAARKNLPVVYMDPMLGNLLFARIAAIRKDYALIADVAKGKAAEVYTVELWPMSRARSVTVVDPARVRLAETEDLRDISQYRGNDPMPLVRPELLCEEIKRSQ